MRWQRRPTHRNGNLSATFFPHYLMRGNLATVRCSKLNKFSIIFMLKICTESVCQSSGHSTGMQTSCTCARWVLVSVRSLKVHDNRNSRWHAMRQRLRVVCVHEWEKYRCWLWTKSEWAFDLRWKMEIDCGPQSKLVRHSTYGRINPVRFNETDQINDKLWI